MIRTITISFLLVTLLAVAALPLVASAQAKFNCGTGFIKYPCINAQGPAGQRTFGGVVLAIINTLLLVVGALAVLFLIIGGFRYVTAEGSEERVEAAKKTMWHAILGIMIVILSFSIIAIVTNFLIGGTAGV